MRQSYSAHLYILDGIDPNSFASYTWWLNKYTLTIDKFTSVLTVYVFYWTNKTENHRCILSETWDIAAPYRCDKCYQVLRKCYHDTEIIVDIKTTKDTDF